MSRNWRVQSLGVLEALTEAAKAIDFVKARRYDILKILACAWGAVLLMTFTMILTVRLALAL